jgi:soluble lytic murein transglycosylase-like protein
LVHKAIVRLCLFALALAAAGARADIYMFIDKNGIKNYSNVPLDSRYKPFVFGANGPGTEVVGIPNVPPIGTPPLKESTLRALTQHPNLKKYEPILQQAAKDYSVDVALLKAVMAAESRFNPAAVSRKGAIGLMQVMPATAERYGLVGDKTQTVRQKLHDPETNIRLGARYLRDLQQMFPRQFDLMLASYNAGEGAVQKYKNQIPPYPETRNYVQVVTKFYQLYKPSI